MAILRTQPCTNGCCLVLLQNMRGGAVRKAEKLREMLEDYGQCGDLQDLNCPLPLDPSIQLAGIVPQECSVFKSALAPLRLTFRTSGAPHFWSLL